MEVEFEGKFFRINKLRSESNSAFFERIDVFKTLLSKDIDYQNALKYSEIFFYKKYLGCKYSTNVDDILNEYI